MAQEGVEKLLNITDRSYITFYTTSTTPIARVLYNYCSVNNLYIFWKKIKHVYFSRLERQRTLSLSL